MIPQFGDIAYYTTCVEGGDPYQVWIVYRLMPIPGWYNVVGRHELPLDPGYVDRQKLMLVASKGSPVVEGVEITEFTREIADCLGALR